MRRLIVLTVLAGAMVPPAAASQAPKVVRIGTISDGPWDRSQDILVSVRRLVESRLGNRYTVTFPGDKRLQGDWTAAAAYHNVSRLLDDPDVDVMIALGLLSSYDLVRRGPLPKPAIATRVLEPDLLFVAYQYDPRTRKRVSSVPNLSYITVPGEGLRSRVQEFRRLAPFNHVTFLVMEALQDLFPDLRSTVEEQLDGLGVDFKLVLVDKSISSAVAALPEEPTAVMMTLLPQLEPEDFKRLLRILNDLRLPTFMLGSRGEVRQGVLAGSRPVEEFTRVANRVATNLKAILEGTPAEMLPVDLDLREKLAINLETAAALGIDAPASMLQGADVVDTTEIALVESPSLASVGEDRVPRLEGPAREVREESDRQREARVRGAIGRTLNGLPRYGVFDSLSFRFEGDTATLLGYVWTAALQDDAAEAVRALDGVEAVEDYIEILPLSSDDDRIRAEVYIAIYNHPLLIRYSPDGGFSHFDTSREGEVLSAGLKASAVPMGPHPVRILVRRGDVALVGVVEREAHRRVAEQQARTVAGVRTVENYIEVRD